MSIMGPVDLLAAVTTSQTSNPMKVLGLAKCAFQVFRNTGAAGTHTVTFQGTVDGTNWVALVATPIGGGAGVSVTGAGVQGIWIADCYGLRSIRVVLASLGVDTLTATACAVTS